MRRSLPLLAWALGSLSLSGCVKGTPPSPENVADASPAPSAKLDEVPRPMPGAAPTSVSGVVVEHLTLPTYSYLNLDTGGQKVWAAVPRTEVSVGQRVTISNAMLMSGYHSAALNRDFEKVYFGTLNGAVAPSASSPHGTANDVPAPTGSAVVVPKASAPDAKTIVEIAKSKSLAGKPVTVRGVVVKLNLGILGKTWLHLQDGTGNAGDKTHDLLVTTTQRDLPKVGDTVLVHGKVENDKDFGAGYRFQFLVDAESIKKEASPKP
ncbi:MAG: hypothetical protein U0263_37185 [Polyangiaceae bacterium]